MNNNMYQFEPRQPKLGDIWLAPNKPFVNVWNGTSWEAVMNHKCLEPTGKVVILKDNERVIDKWDYYLLRTISYLLLVALVLRVLAWWLS